MIMTSTFAINVVLNFFSLIKHSLLIFSFCERKHNIRKNDTFENCNSNVKKKTLYKESKTFFDVHTSDKSCINGIILSGFSFFHNFMRVIWLVCLSYSCSGNNFALHWREKYSRNVGMSGQTRYDRLLWFRFHGIFSCMNSTISLWFCS